MKLLRLAVAFTAVIRAQQSPIPSLTPQVNETLIVGRTTLKLGMAREYVTAALAEYDLTLALVDGYAVRAGGKPNSEKVAEVYFDKSGLLEYAVKHLTTSQRHATDGEIGRVLFSLIGALPNGGACSFVTVSMNAAGYNGAPPGKVQSRDAYIECGHKRYGLKTTTMDGEDSLDITEEIDVETALQREGGVSPSELRPVKP